MPVGALGVSPDLLLKPVREPREPVSQGQELITPARIKPELGCRLPERLRDATKPSAPVGRGDDLLHPTQPIPDAAANGR